ncbi:BON domain-containing protein [bacterium]|nr:BON domain-containing protein [bacterium]
MRFRICLIFSLLFFAVTLASCSSTPMKRSFSEYWQDKSISMNVRSKLVHSEEIRFSNMGVYAWRGVVTLLGNAGSPEERELAEVLAAEVDGVIAVKNYLEIIGDEFIANDNLLNEKTTTKKLTNLRETKPSDADIYDF